MRKRRNRVRHFMTVGMMALCLMGCGKQQEAALEETIDFVDLLPEQSEPVIIREPQTQEQNKTEEESQTAMQEEEITPFADRNVVSYALESASFEEGIVKVEYPQFTDMENADLQSQMNEKIRQAVMQGSDEEGLSAYELSYEIATAGQGIVSVVFRGYVNYEGAAHPSNIAKTLNLDLTTGDNLRLKDYADIAGIVSGLENASGYAIISEGVDQADFSAFLNNGYVTDYAITMLDYDVDFSNLSLIPTGYSCIRDNHVVLFIEAEHAMGDFVEIEFDSEL